MGTLEDKPQVLMLLTEEELVVLIMAGFGTPHVPVDGSWLEAHHFSMPTPHVPSDLVALCPELSRTNMTAAHLGKAVEFLTLLN